ncbi:MAG: thiosulfate oxidation carrier complex protein SoxZ [Geminicoccaceae bacterium]
MANVKPRIRAPKSASAGEIVEIKTLISHNMESGVRKDSDGNVIPRQIINKFVATYNGNEVFSADWHPALSANPYLSFMMRIDESGELNISWTDDDGTVYEKGASIEVA